MFGKMCFFNWEIFIKFINYNCLKIHLHTYTFIKKTLYIYIYYIISGSRKNMQISSDYCPMSFYWKSRKTAKNVLIKNHLQESKFSSGKFKLVKNIHNLAKTALMLQNICLKEMLAAIIHEKADKCFQNTIDNNNNKNRIHCLSEGQHQQFLLIVCTTCETKLSDNKLEIKHFRKINEKKLFETILRNVRWFFLTFSHRISQIIRCQQFIDKFSPSLWISLFRSPTICFGIHVFFISIFVYLKKHENFRQFSLTLGDSLSPEC